MQTAKRKGVFQTMGGFRPKSGGKEINGRTYSEYPKIRPMTDQTKQKLHRLQVVNEQFEKQQFKKTVLPLST